MTYPTFCADLYEGLINKLALIDNEKNSRMKKAELSVQTAETIIIELQSALETHSFVDKPEEIFFFKEVRPSFYCLLLFHSRVYQIELGRPPGDSIAQLTYLQKEIDRLSEFYEANKFIYKYLKSGSTQFDEKMFFRPTTESVYAFRMYSLMEEPVYPTSYDPLVAQVKAADLLQKYLSEVILEVDPTRVDLPYKRTLVWTESKSALIELAYALHAAGVFNAGKADLKDITDALEYVFQTDCRHYPRTFQEILSRKKGYTNFIDKLKDKLLLRIKVIEDKHIR